MITAKEEARIFQSYGFGEISLQRALLLTGYSEREFLASYKLWIDMRHEN